MWDNIWSLVVDLYGKEKPNVPTRLHPSVKQLKLQIALSKQRFTKFLCEVPTVTGEYGDITLPLNFESPYSPAPGRVELVCTTEHITELNYQIAADAKSSFKQCHQVLRDPAKELLVFMLTDKDRKQDNNVPYSYPVAYAMKGSSITNDHMQFMLSKVRSELKKRNIPILCEAYDGQWHKLITENETGQRLTKLHSRDNWNRVSSLSKGKGIEQLNAISVVKKSTLNEVSTTRLQKNETLSMPEIIIAKGRDGVLFVSTEKRQMKHIHSITLKSRPDLFTKQIIEDDTTDIGPHDVLLEEEQTTTDVNGQRSTFKAKYRCRSIYNNTEQNEEIVWKNKTKRLIGLGENEIDMFDIPEIRPPDNIEDEEDLENVNVDRFKEDRAVEQLTLENYLKSEKCSLLPNILNELKNNNLHKWQLKNIDDLYPELLTNGDNLLREVNVKELHIISLEMRCLTGHSWHSNNMLKSEIVNNIVKGFGGDTLVPVERRVKKIFNPESLSQLCSVFIKGCDFPLEHIQIPIASLYQIIARNDWWKNATVPMLCEIPLDNGKTEMMEFFSYPGYSTHLGQTQFRTFDFTHVLTNIRTQILTRGLDYCKKEHFEHLSTKEPGLLSLALVFEKTDQQNAFTAMRMFNYDVEHYMRRNNFNETANFIKLVRNWHDACNRRGLSADTRVKYLYEMHKFLTDGVNFDSVPFPYCGRYIKGLTWQTYEAILQMISMRIQLYRIAENYTYNTRAVSTLANESFFSDLVRYDKESHGYPKGTNVSRVFGRVVLINHFKHKRGKNYYLAATVKCKYEIKLADLNFRRYIRNLRCIM